MTALLWQAFRAADVSEDALQVVLGPSVDVLVWILKTRDAERPSGMRPLQLPTCFRRLFGAALAEAVGPRVEPHLSVDQAARAGGTCGPNIRRAYDHLSSAAASVREPCGRHGRGGVWDALGVGPRGGPLADAP